MDDATERPLFGSVPSDLFKIFAGPARHFYADLLTQLVDDPFGHNGEIATRSRVLDAIAEVIDRTGRALVVSKLSEEEGSDFVLQSHQAAYRRLRATGWLVEYRDRYRRVVDFDPAARLLLHTLLDIQNGRVRSYGGAVLKVLTLLRSVIDDPDTNALNAREAALAARGFMNHLHTVAGTMRKIEDLIMKQPSATALVRRFVEDFIESLVVQDYRNLHSRESPYRFRSQIVDVGEELLEDDDKLARVARGWVAGGIAREAAQVRDQVIADIREVVRVFSAIDDHVREIETTTYRIEKRMTNVVRFSDRMATISTGRILEALSLLGSSGLPPHAEMDVRTRLQLLPLPIGQAQFYSPPRRRAEATEREIEVRPPDPALSRYLAALDLFEGRVGITPERLERYIEAALGENDALPASDFPLRDIDDFLTFERLHEAGFGPLADRFELEPVDGRLANDWIERDDFVLRRKARANG
ncbi:MAG: Wadjet anti-phage system protein JetA family protein [Sphingomonas sp.]|jgi:hypothetical protein|uniref:Wadjet anti-phage system protein JetA family protein n=1 Tax=Sphingomonas sp. TaxID=28214 RepID=UPI0035631873